MIGAEPHTDWLDGFLERDEHGFILTGPEQLAARAAAGSDAHADASLVAAAS